MVHEYSYKDLNKFPPKVRNLILMAIKNLSDEEIKDMKVFQAETVEEFNQIASKYGLTVQRVRELNPFVRFYFVGLGFGERPDKVRGAYVKDTVIAFVDLGIDGVTYALKGQYKYIPLDKQEQEEE